MGLKESGRSCTIGCLSIIGLFVLIGFCTSQVGTYKDGSTTPKRDVPKRDWRQENNSSMAYVMMERFVKQQLRSPKSADFPGIFDGVSEHTKYLGDHKYRIISYVDAQNAFGATVRNNFVGVIEQVGESQWKLISLEIIPR